MFRLLLSASLLAPVLGQQKWNYDQCDTVNGPAGWAAPCQDQTSQTPIDLCNAVAFTTVPTFVTAGYTTTRDGTINNNGYGITLSLTGSDLPELSLGNIAQIVGRSSEATNFTWRMVQTHLHWGRTGLAEEGSEHYLWGARYPAEMHYVHYNTKYPNISVALSSGNSDALLVVGTFLTLSNVDVDLMVLYAQDAGTLTSTQKPVTGFKLSDLFDGTGDFFSYAGSLTTPTCNPAVTWVVMKDSKPITLATLNKIKTAKASTGLISDEGNFRPLMPRAGRALYASNSADTGGACTTPVEPIWVCSTGAAMQMVFSPIFLLSSVAMVLFSTI